MNPRLLRPPPPSLPQPRKKTWQHHYDLHLKLKEQNVKTKHSGRIMLRFKVRYYLFIILSKWALYQYSWLCIYIEEMSRKYRADHFLSFILRSALKICWNYRGQTVLKFDFGTKDGGPFLTLYVKVRLEIWFWNWRRAISWLMLCFMIRSSIIINVRNT